MNKCESVAPLSVREILAKHTVSELISTAKNLGLKGYSGKTKGNLVEMLYQRVTNRTFLEDMLLICDRQIWESLLIAASASSPTPIPDIDPAPYRTLTNLGMLQWEENGSGATITMPLEIRDAFGQFESDGFIDRKDRSDLLDHYALAATHLYGIISQDEFISIFNAQNSRKTNADEVFTVLIQHISAGAPYGFWDEYLTHSLFEENEYKDAKDLLQIINGKRRFIPEKSAFLQYREPNFYDRAPVSDRFERYLREKFFCSAQKAEEITTELVFACSVDAKIGKALTILDGYNLSLTKEDIRGIIPLLVDLATHTRKWSTCGFTPEELHQQNLHSSPIRKGRKIGRNEPCPCGSGKKYKKCCGR